MLMFIQDIYSK